MEKDLKKRLNQKALQVQLAIWKGIQKVWLDTSAEGYVYTGVKIIISVVIGGLLLTGLYALFQLTILPGLETKIQELFSYGS